MKRLKIQTSKIFDLSIDVILCKIIPYLLSRDVLSLKKTCKYFYNLIKTNKNLLFKLLYDVKKEIYYVSDKFKNYKEVVLEVMKEIDEC